MAADETMQKELVPPLELINRADISRSLRELEALEDYLTNARIRNQAAKLPRLSPVIEGLARDNKLDLIDAAHRLRARDLLVYLQKLGPVIHIAFAVEPSAAMQQKLLQWLRREISPFCLLVVGIQPSLGGGCIVRTPNKVFDFGLRQHLQKKSHLLLEAIQKVAA